MSASFVESFIKHFAATYSLPVEEVRTIAQEAQKSAVPPAGSIPQKPSSTASTSKSRTPVDTKCCHVTIKKETKLEEVCGKNARNEFPEGSGCWYCGTDKSGHYKTAISRAAKSETPKATTAVNTVAAKAKTANTAVPAVLQRVTAQKVKEMFLHEVPAGSGQFINLSNRILFNHSTNKAYAVLAEDNNTHLPLEDSHIRFLEANNIGFEQQSEEDEVEISAAPVAKVAPTVVKAVVAKPTVTKVVPVATKVTPVVAKVTPTPVAKVTPAVAKVSTVTIAKPAPPKPVPQRVEKVEVIEDDENVEQLGVEEEEEEEQPDIEEEDEGEVEEAEDDEEVDE